MEAPAVLTKSDIIGPTYPASIRQFIDEGGDLTTIDDGLAGWLAELVVFERHYYGFDQLAKHRQAQKMRRRGLSAEEQDWWKQAAAKQPEFALMQAIDQLFDDWAEELVADELLCERIQALLPPDVVAYELEGVEVERGHKFRLTVESRETYMCAATATEHTGPAIVIHPRGYVADNMPEVSELVFSPEAIEGVLRQARSSDN